ncbi:dihydroneopterin aldolase [Selenomonas caprae]|uniref:7,8-dihydroneopterin aldolase n=1 Tax=Selenomonas caprae TaxID=2606905 RepID=A0A5D6WI00_9FIRM|nr:dihydroneopterin aldolase [Selenomonas caprae]TYZ26709.1 dihydroneopterin aldolase [Selenomonas caprae]
MDKIKLTGLEFYGYHGCLPEEREQGQPFYIDLTMYADLQPAGVSDDLAQTINYAEVYATVKAIVEGDPCQLIETVGERVATAVLQGYAKVQKVRVTVHKPQAPLPGKFGDAAISVVRTRA